MAIRKTKLHSTQLQVEISESEKYKFYFTCKYVIHIFYARTDEWENKKTHRIDIHMRYVNRTVEIEEKKFSNSINFFT